MSPVQAELAQMAAGLSPERVGPGARQALGRLLPDYLACAVAGAGSSAAQRLRAAVLRDTSGPCTVFGETAKAPAPLAAFVNGHAGHVLEFDDVHVQSIYHPGVTVMPAALAVAERAGLSPRDVQAGILAGYEIGIRLGEAAGMAHYRRHHTTGTVGCIGAAVAAARTMGLPADRISSAIGLAATQAAALWAFQGGAADAKAVHAGHAAMVGVMSADMAAAGLEGPTAALAGPSGFLETLGGDPGAACLVTDLREEALRIERVSIKPHACCGHTHSGIEAAHALRIRLADAGQDVDGIRALRVETYGAAIRVAGVPRPTTPEEACFSYPHIVAFVLVHGSLAGAFEPPALEDSQVARLARVTRLVSRADLDPQYPARQPVLLTAEFEGGASLTAEASFGAGSPELPMSADALAAKLTGLAGAQWTGIAQYADGWLGTGTRAA